MKQLPSLSFAFLLMLANAPNAAGETDAIDIRFSGFATLAVVHNDSEQLGYRSNAGQNLYTLDGDYEHRSDSRLGLQWNINWSNQFDAAVQLVIDHAARAHDEDYLDWAFLRYRPQDGDEIRLGRIGFDVFMLSDYRQIGYTYPWVRPPLDFYGLIALYSMDGVDYQHRFDWDNGTLYAKLFTGQSHYHAPLRSGDFSIDLKPIYGFTLLYEQEPWKARISHTELEFAGETQTQPLIDALDAASALWPEAAQLANELAVKDTTFTYSALGLSYDDNHWLLQAEVAQVRGERDLLPTSKHAYLSFARRLNAFTPYLVFGWARPNHQASSATLPATIPPFLLPQFELLRTETLDLMNRTRVDQDSIGLGLRWEVRSRMAFKLQVDRYRVHDNGSGLWHPDYPEPDTATVTSVALDVLF